MTGLILLAVILALVPLILILGETIYQGLPVMSLSFLTNIPAPVGVSGGGVGPAILGTLTMVGIATLISVPLGVAAGIFFSEWPESRLSTVSSFMNDVLAEFPSIVIGIFVYLIIVVTTKTFSAVAGALALSIIMLPIVARTTEESLKLVPRSLREASIALGVSRWRTVIRVVIGTGKLGLATGILLAIARAAGETAPLLLTALGTNFFARGLFQPTAALPLLIYTYGISPYAQWHADAWGAASFAYCLHAHLESQRQAYHRETVRQRESGGLGELEMQTQKMEPEDSEVVKIMTPNGSESAKLETKNIVAGFGKVQVLRGIGLSFNNQSITALMGPSGCGKTTFIRCLNRLHELTPGAYVKGEVTLDGTNIYDPTVNPDAIRRRIGMVFQKPNPFPTMSVYDNVAAGLKLNGVRDRRLLDEVVEKSLRMAFLWDEVKGELKKSGAALSGGQQQRLCIAQAIAVQPEIILMDEPCSALDPTATSKIEEAMGELKRDFTIVIVTHNLQQAARVADYTGFFYLGELVEYDTTKKMFEAPSKELTERYITGKFG